MAGTGMARYRGHGRMRVGPSAHWAGCDASACSAHAPFEKEYTMYLGRHVGELLLWQLRFWAVCRSRISPCGSHGVPSSDPSTGEYS